MAAFASTAILHPSGLQAREAQREPSAADLQHTPATAQLQPLTSRAERKNRNTVLSPPIPQLAVVLTTRFFALLSSKNISSLSFPRCITVPWKIARSLCQFSATRKELYFWKNRVWGNRATGLFWIGCLKQEPGKIQANKSVCRQPRHKKSSFS